MNKSDIGLNAGKIWRLLSNYAKWDYGTLKRKSGLKDKELGAALGWLACEDKIVLHQENEELYIFLGVNVYKTCKRSFLLSHGTSGAAAVLIAGRPWRR